MRGNAMPAAGSGKGLLLISVFDFIFLFFNLM
jgi:hypothetical protein